MSSATSRSGSPSVSIDKARRTLGLAPRPLAATLVDTVDSLERLGLLGAPG